MEETSKVLGRVLALVVMVALAAGGCTVAGEPNAQGKGSQAAECAVARPPDRPGRITVSVYFACGWEVLPVPRQLPADAGPEEQLTLTLRELLRGPTAAESRAGFRSWFSRKTAGKLKRVTLTTDGRVVVDFADFRSIPSINNAATSNGARELLGQLNQTLFQFEFVKEIDYRINGSCAEFWGWLQSYCHVVRRG